MTVQDLINKNIFTVITQKDTTREISKPFCCDLLSIAMSKAPAGAAWVTIMGNINTLAVASLTESACVILAEGVVPDSALSAKAETENITILGSDMPIFEAAKAVFDLING